MLGGGIRAGIFVKASDNSGVSLLVEDSAIATKPRGFLKRAKETSYVLKVGHEIGKRSIAQRGKVDIEIYIA